MRSIKSVWRDAVMQGGLWRDMTLRDLVQAMVSFCVGALCMFGLRAYTNSGPSVISQRPPESMTAEVRGVSMIVRVRHTEIRSPCNGSYAVRRLVRFLDNDPRKRPIEIAFFRERDIGWPGLGAQDYMLHLTLYQPLQGDGWHLVYERHDNCGLFDDLFPSRAITGPPIPVTVAPS